MTTGGGDVVVEPPPRVATAHGTIRSMNAPEKKQQTARERPAETGASHVTAEGEREAAHVAVTGKKAAEGSIA
ncbi:hypothetical protein OG233_03285 [Streptomyces sp. NBC_01218]|uniref:hypothetical protein n=1 Tax=Streptomyces sp. NBC_01218 TaxID=2903780 RepID=UPI002E12697D|nr:hypothetical protein OG233_03285 [Streptomyces sp. NBC_01218]